MDYLEYTNFFEGLASKHTSIQHSNSSKSFFRLNLEEILGDLRNGIDVDSYAMVLESYEHTAKDNHSENHLRDFTGAFIIIKRVAIADYEAEILAINECEKIAIEISKRIYADSINNYATRIFTNIEPSDFSFQKVGPIYNTWYGFRCQFNFADTYSIAVDTNKWTDL